MFAQIAGMFEELRLRRKREAEEQKRRWAIEEERRRAEMERKRETVRFRRLLSHTQAWRDAAGIRAFVVAVAASPPSTDDAERFAAWRPWALGHADCIDPLRAGDLFDSEVDDSEVYALRD